MAREVGIRLLLLLVRIVAVGETFAELAASLQFVGHVLLGLCLCHGTSVTVLSSLLRKDLRTSLSFLLRCDLIVVLFLLDLLLLLVVKGVGTRALTWKTMLALRRVQQRGQSAIEWSKTLSSRARRPQTERDAPE